MSQAAQELRIEFGPQSGPQTDFLSTEADIAIYGGSAGGGKTFALLLEPLHYIDYPDYGGVIFRKTSVQVRNEGGLWDESMKLYPFIGAKGLEYALEWNFDSGARVKFAHLEYDKNVYDWQGSQICFLGFDELTHFSEFQFWYMLSRNRSTCGVRPYVRATTNPDVDSWVRKLIDWWIDADGLAIPERAGSIRWFIRQSEQLIWADSPEEIYDRYGRGPEIQPKSLTFIPAKITDNQILMQKDPGYLANLMALSRVDRMRLKEGNWNVRASAGSYFRREWFDLVDATPAGTIDIVRYWDKGATRPNEDNPDPDWTRGLKLHKLANGKFIVTDLRSLRDTPLNVERMVRNTAAFDGVGVKVCVEQDPGSAGVADAENYARLLAGFEVRVRKPTKDKETRAKPVSAQVEAGNIMVLRAPWNDEFFTELENFPTGSHDDIVDTLSGAFNEMCSNASILDVL